MKKIDNGLVLTTCGGDGQFGYKKSLDQNNIINTMVEDNFKNENVDFLKYPFNIKGSDERQYSSQAFKINTITITKNKYYDIFLLSYLIR